jgi:hypothetical protein
MALSLVRRKPDKMSQRSHILLSLIPTFQSSQDISVAILTRDSFVDPAIVAENRGALLVVGIKWD